MNNHFKEEGPDDADPQLTDEEMDAISSQLEALFRHAPPLPGMKVNLGDEVLYRGHRWWLDDERLKGLEGQGDLRYEEFDLGELASVSRARDVFADETGDL